MDEDLAHDSCDGPAPTTDNAKDGLRRNFVSAGQPRRAAEGYDFQIAGSDGLPGSAVKDHIRAERQIGRQPLEGGDALVGKREDRSQPRTIPPSLPSHDPALIRKPGSESELGSASSVQKFDDRHLVPVSYGTAFRIRAVLLHTAVS